jgi:hypothetical protein
MEKVGRPTVMTPETIARLEDAFLIGATDKEACLVANIGMTTLYAYCQENPEFAERKEALKDTPKYKARKNVSVAIESGDKQVSQWYLERKVKDEFAQRTEQTGKEGKDLIPDKESKEKVDVAISSFINDTPRNPQQ